MPLPNSSATTTNLSYQQSNQSKGAILSPTIPTTHNLPPIKRRKGATIPSNTAATSLSRPCPRQMGIMATSRVDNLGVD